MGKLFLALFSVFIFGLGSLYAEVSVGEVDKLVKENNVKEVGYDYVLSKIGDGRVGHTKAILLDARPEKRFNAGHIPGALLMLDTKVDETIGAVLKDVPKNKEIITYCQGPNCEKSVNLAIELKKRGYTNVKVYRGGLPEWETKAYVDIGLEAAKAMYDKNGALFIDARPFGKFKQGTIVGAINILDTDFDKLWGRLPTDTRTPVVIFCGGIECEKSHVVAQRMMMMGYSKVYTFSEGYPAWVKAGYDTTAGGAKASEPAQKQEKKTSGPIVLGSDEGTVDVEYFKGMIKNKPENIVIVDIRDAGDYQKGHLKGAVNIPKKDNDVAKMKGKISADKYTIFTCGTGTRALEMWVDFKSSGYGNMDKVFYLDAKVNCKGQECEIEGY